MKWRKSNRGKREMGKCCKLHEAWALGDRLHSTRVREQAASYQDPPPDEHHVDQSEYDQEHFPEPAPVVVYRPLADVARISSHCRRFRVVPATATVTTSENAEVSSFRSSATVLPEPFRRGTRDRSSPAPTSSKNRK